MRMIIDLRNDGRSAWRTQPRLGTGRGVIILLNDTSAIHHPNLVIVFSICQLMGDQQGGLLMRSGVQRLHHPLFAVGIKASDRLIE